MGSDTGASQDGRRNQGECKATLSFPRWHWAPLVQAASFPTLFSTASGVAGLVAGPSSALRSLEFE
jgi:hypothetical protein